MGDSFSEKSFDNRSKFENSGDSTPDHLPPWLLHAMAFVLYNFHTEEDGNEYEFDFIDIAVVFVFDKSTYQGEGLHYFGINHRGVIHQGDWFSYELGYAEFENYGRGVGRVVPPDNGDAESFWSMWWTVAEGSNMGPTPNLPNLG
jgi:hypothetical protein